MQNVCHVNNNKDTRTSHNATCVQVKVKDNRTSYNAKFVQGNIKDNRISHNAKFVQVNIKNITSFKQFMYSLLERVYFYNMNTYI